MPCITPPAFESASCPCGRKSYSDKTTLSSQRAPTPRSHSQARVRVGIAGWANPSEAQERRRAGETHLEYYARHFACVEINSTFYRSHRADTYARWRESTPDDFRFSVKLPRSITHESVLKGVRRDVNAFLNEIEPLEEKLSAILIQLPPSLVFDRRLLKRFMTVMPRHAAQLVIEPRHPTWFTESADKLLAELGIARAGADPPRALDAGCAGGKRAFAYFRWHGSPRVYYSSYSREQLAGFAAQLPRGAREIWCIFDNTAAGAAWHNATAMRDTILRRSKEARRAMRRS